MDRRRAPVLAGSSVSRTEGDRQAQELPPFSPRDCLQLQSGYVGLLEVEHPGDPGIAQRPLAERLSYRRERPTSLPRHASTSGQTPAAHVGQDVLVVPGDLIARGLVHVDERELRPSRMLCDLISLARRDRSLVAKRENFRSVAMAMAVPRSAFNLRSTSVEDGGRRGSLVAPRPGAPRRFISSPHLRGTAMARNLYFLGTAGSGKSTMVFAFQLWMNSQGLDCITVNLDPGAEALQYSPDLDVRDYVNIEEIMTKQGLGPNGAQVAEADMVAMNAKELADVHETFEQNYVLIDTPGQIELFTFRASGPELIDAFGREDAALVYLNDPALVRNPGGFISSVLLNATVQFRHSLPFINVLSKADLTPAAELERIVKWSVDPFALYEALFEEAATAKTLLDVEFLKSLETIGVYRRVHPVSSEITFGFEEIYSQVQLAFEGGEDLSKD